MRRTLPLLIGCLIVAVLIVSGSHARTEPRIGGSSSTGILAIDDHTSRPPAEIPLRDGWGYLADPQNVGLAQNWERGGAPGSGWAPVALPNDFNPVVTSSADRGTVGWYEIHFTGPPSLPGRSWSVHFESVRRAATVWLNGVRLGRSSDPYAPFALPATGLEPGTANALMVRVDNFRGRAALPEDWWNWGGILGPVTLEPQGRLALEDLGVMPRLGCRLRCGVLLVDGTVANLSRALLAPELVVRVSDPAGRLVSVARLRLHAVRAGRAVGLRSVAVRLHRPPVLWSPRDPALYTVRIELDATGRAEQEQTARVGMRSVAVRGGILYLNGHRLWLHGASIHEDVIGRGAALTDSDIATIVSELRSLGANITRSHYLLSPRLLDALDAAGIMVWEQSPVDHADPALRFAAGRRRALGLLRSTLIGDRSHPSVIVNSIGNELSPNPDATPGTRSYLTRATALARALDPAALVGLDTYCYTGFPKQRIYSGLDVLGVSSYFGWYRGLPRHSIASFAQMTPFLRETHARYPRQAVAISEFGAEGLYHGPTTVKGTYEFQSDYMRRTLGAIARLPFMNGSIYWTLREFAVRPGWTGGARLPAGEQPNGVHHKGLIAYDGTAKPALSLARRLLREVPRFVG